MKKKLLVLLATTCALNMVACGTETKKTNSNTGTSNQTATESTTTKDTATNESQTEDKSEGEKSVLDKLLENFEATNTVNTTDVSKYSFGNKNIVLNVKFNELSNVSSMKTSVYKSDYSGVEEIEFVSWDDYKDKFDENEDNNFNIRLYFNDGTEITMGKRKLDCFNALGKYYIFCKDLKSAHCQTFETLLDNGAFRIKYDDLNGKSLDITNYVDIGLEKGAEVSEQLLKLKELWGNPSIIKSTKKWVHMSWCFGNTSVTVHVMGVLDQLMLEGVEYSWTSYQQMLDFINDKQYEKYKAPEVQESYTPNLPEKALMTYGDVTVPLINNTGSSVFEVMDSIVFPEGTEYKKSASENIKFYYVPGEGSGWTSKKLEINGCNDGTGNVKKISIDFQEGMNMPELSILGIKAGSTLHDIFTIFGKPEEYFTDTLTYEVMIDGVSTRVYMSLGEQYGTKAVKSMTITFFYEK